MTITKNGSAQSFPGSTITYTGTLTNVGGTAAYNVVLVDTLPNDVSFVSSSHVAIYDSVSNTVTWNLGNLAGSASVSGPLTLTLHDFRD